MSMSGANPSCASHATAPSSTGDIARLTLQRASRDCGALAIHFLVKTAAIPSVRVEPSFRAELEAVLADGETLSQFVEASVRASVEPRRVHAEFVARGLRSRDEALRTGDYVDADVVLEGLQRKLDIARVRLAKKGK